MSRLQEMDNFLKVYATYMEQNPNFKPNYETIYDSLAIYGIKNKDINSSLFNIFDSWKNRYNDSKYKNLRVYWIERQKKFLHFVNYKGNYSRAFKLFVSFPKDKIFDGTNYIFDFINNKNIESYSKVTDSVRSDDVIIRITNKKDLDKIFKFINSNSFIVNNCQKTNPFIMRNGVVGFAYDDTESYNYCLAKILSIYFNNIKDTNNFENCNLNNFQLFVDDFYKKTFITKENLNNFNLDIIYNYNGYGDDSEKLLVFKQIIELLKFAVRGDFDFKNYCSFIDNCRNNRNNELIKKSFRNQLNKDSININEIKDLFLESCLYTCNKYGKDHLISALKMANGGSFSKFSNDNNYRIRMNNDIPKSYLKSLCFYYVGDEDLPNDNLFDTFASYIAGTLKSDKKKKN